ncbi:hypothetical protein BGZ95_003767, partial [Linnemannia exigua]
MDPLSNLPIECLERIFDFIALPSTTTVYNSRYSDATLFPTSTAVFYYPRPASFYPTRTSLSAFATLCRVNKRIASITLPYLYRDPFQPINRLGSLDATKGPRSRDLLLTLLKPIPVAKLHPALLLSFEMNASPSPSSIIPRTDTSPSQLGNLTHVRHLNLQPFAFLEYKDRNRKEYSAAELEYIRHPGFLDVFLMGRKDTFCQRRVMSYQFLGFYTAILYREASWSLAGPILEQLESLTLPLSDIRRYLQGIDRLGRLERIHFVLDWNMSCMCCRGTRLGREDPRKQYQEEAAQLLIQFIEDHGRLFPGRLMHVDASVARFWYSPQDLPGGTLQEILRILPPLYKATSIDETNWPRIAAHLQTTDFSHVHSIDWSVPTVEYKQVLQRCRSLREIYTRDLAPNSFDWAVQEKKDMLNRLGQGTIYPVPIGHRPDALSSQPAHLTYGLVPLTRFHLQEYFVSSRDLDAITFAFSQSLEELIIRNIRGLTGNDNHHITHLIFGRIGLPILRRLELRSPHYRVVLDPLVFAQCPSLRSVSLNDDTFEYSCQYIVPWLPSQAPLLRIVDLKGWSALTFNPATLASAKKLYRLSLTMICRDEGYCFIPPIDELDASYGVGDKDDGKEEHKQEDKVENETSISHAITTRPQWTWDWFLPSLWRLELTSEFAYRFEFRMLQGCPALCKLRLYMRTSEGHLYRRLISEADLFVSGSGESRDRIVAPMLKYVSMNGPWVIEDSLMLEQLLGGMFPKLKQLSAIGWEGGGFSIESFVKMMRSTGGRIRKVKTNLNAISKEDENELGVYRLFRDNKNKDKDVLRTRL